VGVDISPIAISVSAKNAERFNLSKRLELICGDWRNMTLGCKYDFIVSNPPYIPRAMKEALQKEVRLFEPDLALFVDDQLGLEFYESFSKNLKPSLNPDGFVAFELGAGQAQYVMELFSDWKNCNLVEDLSGIARVFTARTS
jgi:release factor glutamine methyltransferase